MRGREIMKFSYQLWKAGNGRAARRFHIARTIHTVRMGLVDIPERMKREFHMSLQLVSHGNSHSHLLCRVHTTLIGSDSVSIILQNLAKASMSTAQERERSELALAELQTRLSLQR